MPFNFPIQQNNFGELFSRGISEALNSYYQGKQFQRQRAFDALALQGQGQEQALGRAAAARQGIHLDQPGQIVPSGDLAPRVDIPTSANAVPSFSDTVTNAMNGVPNAKMPATPTPNDRADQGELQIPERTFFQGGYINNREGMIPMLLNATMAARAKGMETTAEMNAKEPFAQSAFQRGLQGDEYRAGLDVTKQRTLAGDRAAALTGASVPGGGTINPQTAAAIGAAPGTAGALLRPAAMIPGSPEWRANEQFKSDLAQQRTLNLLAPKTQDALNRKQGELALTPLNKTEDTATQQLPRMVRALSYLQQNGTPSALAHAASGGNWTNYLNSPEGQKLSQAADEAAMAGALATEGPRGAQPTRVEFYRRTFVPRGGDSPDLVQRKLEGLRELAKSVKVSAGRGYDRMDAGQRAQVEQFISGQPQNPYRPQQ